MTLPVPDAVPPPGTKSGAGPGATGEQAPQLPMPGRPLDRFLSLTRPLPMTPSSAATPAPRSRDRSSRPGEAPGSPRRPDTHTEPLWLVANDQVRGVPVLLDVDPGVEHP
jgi:hypothetical protein